MKPSAAEIKRSVAAFMKDAAKMPYPVSEAVVAYKRRGLLSPDAKRLLVELLMVGTVFGQQPIPATVTDLPDFVGREEANAMVAYCFRNTRLEDIHSGLEFTDSEMKKLMIESCGKVKAWLELRDTLCSSGFELVYVAVVRTYGFAYAREWRR